MLKKLSDLIKYFEDLPISPGTWVLSVLSIVFIRNCVESIVDYGKFPDFTHFDLLHVPVFFVSVLLAVIVLLHFFTETPIAKVSKAALLFFPVILFPVTLDVVSMFQGGRMANYNYIFEDAGMKFINFFNPLYPIADVPGSLRLEVALVVVIAFIYVFVKTKNALGSAVGAFLIFAVVFGFGAMPSFIIGAFNVGIYPMWKMFSTAELAASMNENIVVIVELTILAILAGMWYWRYDARRCGAVIGNFRWDRAAHYLVMAVLGLRLSQPALPIAQDFFILVKAWALLAGLFFAFQHAVVVNDDADVACDEISNRNRPLVMRTVERGEFLTVGNFFLAFALLFSIWVSDACFMITLLYIAVAFVYSAPPFRFKRFYPLSVIIIGVEALLAFLLGQMAFAEPGTPVQVHVIAAWMVFLAFALGSGIKDIKDFEGDRKTGVATLPTLLGMEKGRPAVAGLAALGYILTAVFLCPKLAHPVLYFFAAAFAGVSFWYISRPDAEERNIFLLYFGYIAVLILTLR